jgi:glucose-6-phosphate dehydrogenase assembly protein OpcA
VIRLEDTSGHEIAAAIARERHRMGSPTTGMVLTLLILTDEERQADSTAAAVASAREHPMRILTLVPRPGGDADRIDADISVGGDDGPGEVAVMRLRGDRSSHANSVAIPLLLPDTPVVAWWPGRAPRDLADDPIGAHAGRRITDVSTLDDPIAQLHQRREFYQPGDTDLSWTRLTGWRSTLAAVLDRPVGAVSSATVTATRDNPSAVLLAAWLTEALRVPAAIDFDTGPGITGVTLSTDSGQIRILRPDGNLALLQIPGLPDAPVALPRRSLSDLIAEELRRMNPDEIYAQSLAAFPAVTFD